MQHEFRIKKTEVRLKEAIDRGQKLDIKTTISSDEEEQTSSKRHLPKMRKIKK